MIRRLVFLVVLALVAVGCGAETTELSEPTETSALNPATTTAAPPSTLAFDTPRELFDAAVGEMQAQSARFEGAFTISGVEGLPGSESLSMEFSGAFDNNAQAFSFLMDMSAFAGLAPADEMPPEMAEMLSEIEMRQIGDVAYMRFPFFTAFLGVETDWIMLPADDSNAAAGTLTNTPMNPADMLRPLREADLEFEDLGRQSVRGVDTTHYRIQVNTETMVAGMTPSERIEFEETIGGIPDEGFPVDVWIDDQGIVRRFILAIDGSQMNHQPGDEFDYLAMSYEIYDVNAGIVVEPPPADQTTDLSTELAGLFGMGG